MAEQTASDAIERSIQRVEAGLLPTTALRSAPARPAHVAEQMAAYRIPGLSLAVIVDHQVAWARGYGVCRLGSERPVTAETRFQAASISKPVAAAAALRLVADGRLELDDDVNDVLTSWKVPANGSWQPRVTLRQLLSHSAGLTVHGFPGYARTDPLPTLTQVLDGTPPANTEAICVNLIPGTQARYSGGGYTILQQLLCDLTGLEFAELMRTLVLEPLGMLHSTYAQPLPSELHDSVASGHEMRGRAPIAGGWHSYPEQAAAGLWTTASDLARFWCELSLAQSGRSNLLPQELAIQMLSPQTDLEHGLGAFLGSSGTDRWAGHSGGNEGYICDSRMYIDQGAGAVAMTNGQNGYELIPELFRAIAQEYGWPGYLPQRPQPVPADPAQLAALAGVYRLPSGPTLRLAVANGSLLLHMEAQPPITLVPTSPTSFTATVVNAEITIQPGNGMVQALTLQQDGQQQTAMLQAAPPT